MVQEVQGVGVRVGEEVGELPFGHEGQVAHIFLGPGRADAGERFFVGRTEDVEDLVELIDIVTAFEEGAST